ncbi:Serine/threonine-protein kinase STE20 [Leucoagaricus sp. SymC.cos]|nr:Serine/threonine-protein kinase STE20 [Leucoagaricus sp. SymC.cos]
MDPGHRTNGIPTTNPGKDEGPANSGNTDLKKRDVFGYGDHADVYKGILDGKPVASDIAAGLAYLHSKHVYHGDLRGANVFLDNDDNAVVTDYGIAHYFNHSDFTLAKSIGTVRWTGPEVVSLAPDPSPKYDKLDVFALGMTILEVFSGQPPYQDKSDIRATFAIAKSEPPKLPESMSNNPELKKLFDDCTRKIPDNRPSTSDAAERLRALLPPEQDRLLRRLISPLSVPWLILVAFSRFMRYVGSWFGF